MRSMVDRVALSFVAPVVVVMTSLRPPFRFRGSRTRHGVPVVLLASLFAGLSASAQQVLYDAGGFEAAAFTPGSVAGQGGWFGSGAGHSTATIHDGSAGSPVRAGDQALTLFRDGDDGLAASYFTRLVSPATPGQPFVTVGWDLYVPANPSPIEFGPGFSVEAYVTGNRRVAAFGIDAADGALYQVVDNTPPTPDFTLTPAVKLNTWQSWRMTLDLAGETASLVVDGVLVADAVPLLEDIDFAAGVRLTDAALTVHPTDGDFAAVEGSAYVDNYVVTASAFAYQPGDYNGNGQVEQGDLDLVLNNWGQSASARPAGWFRDLPSGLVDQNELDGVLNNWGASALPAFSGLPANAPAAVPEPGSLVVLAAAWVAGRPPRARRNVADPAAVRKTLTFASHFRKVCGKMHGLASFDPNRGGI